MTLKGPINDGAATRQLVSLAERLLTQGGTLESSQGNGPVDRDDLLNALERHILSELPPSAATSVTARAAAVKALNASENALRKVNNDGAATNLTDLEISALEAIIEVTGRPSVRYLNGNVQTPGSTLAENQHWQLIILTAKHDINRASESVGRIAIDNNFGLTEGLGTGWRVSGDLVVTNRHVVKDMVANASDATAAWKLDHSKSPSIDFAVTDNSSGPKRFDVSTLVYVAPENDFDLAVLRITSTATSLPEPLDLDWDAATLGEEVDQDDGGKVFVGREIYVVGHPYKQGYSELVASVFGTADGKKRWSPGMVKRVDVAQPLMEHDCSTLGGNSGSCVFSADEHRVVGVHYGGTGVDVVSGKGSANLAIPLSRIVQHQVSNIIGK